MNALLSVENTKDGTRCTFLLPKLFQMPPRLSRANPPECATAFQIADQVLSSQEKLCLEEYSSAITKDIGQKQEEEVQKCMLQHKKEIQKMEADTKSTVHHLESSLMEQEKRFLKQITDLEVQLQRASSSQDSIRTQFLEEAERRVEQQKQADLQLIDLLKSNIDTLRAETKELEARLQARVSIQQNSSKKGREGEKNFEEIVRERKGWTLIHCGSKGHSADYKSTLYNIHIRFEVKNYTDTLPTKEVNKLRDDMREHPETDVGVLISLNTGITSIPSMSLEWTPTNQLILFIPIFLKQDIDLVLHFLDLVFQTVKPYRTMLCDASKQSEYPIIKERMDRALIYAQNGLLRIAQSVNQFTIDIRALQDKIEDMTSHTKTSMAAQREELQSMIAILSGQDIAVEKEEEQPDDLPLVHEKRKSTRNRKKDSFSTMAIE